MIFTVLCLISICFIFTVKEPKMAGFCFDGFPATPGQAAEFEKLLTGYDFFFWKHFATQASQIAPPPIPVTITYLLQFIYTTMIQTFVFMHFVIYKTSFIYW